jgi:hypothetical protein
MKLLKQVSREYKGKSYHKHWVVVPNELIDELKWDEGDELNPYIKDGILMINKVLKYRIKTDSMKIDIKTTDRVTDLDLFIKDAELTEKKDVINDIRIQFIPLENENMVGVVSIKPNKDHKKIYYGELNNIKQALSKLK